jgi:hypothetical protein
LNAPSFLNQKIPVCDILSFEDVAHLSQALSENVTFDTAMTVDGKRIVVSA